MNNFEFPETKQALQDILKLLKCVKWLPRREEMFFLATCNHKYCDDCLKTGGKCSSCDEQIVTEHAIPDSFSKGLLTKLLEFENLLETDGIEVSGAFNTSHDTADDEDDIKSVSDIFASTPEKKKKDDNDEGRPMQENDQKPKTFDSNIGLESAAQTKARGVVSKNKKKSKILSEKARIRLKGKTEEIQGRKSSTCSSSPVTSKLMTPTPATSSRASSVVSFVSCESPASKEKRNGKGETSLHVAARLGKIEKVKQLIEGGANINATDFAGWTPLHEAINGKTSNNLQVATMLCEAGCHISTAGMGGETPLHEASRLGLLSIISLLLYYGANKNISNQSGLLPRDVAKSEEVALVIEEFCGPTVRNCEIDPVSATEERHIYFTYDTEQLDTFKSEFGLQIASELSGDVTHIIFEAKPNESVSLTLDYLLGVLSGAWLLSSKWVVDSLCRKEWLDPGAYEISGCKDETHFSSKNGDPDTTSHPDLVAKRARTNRELRNPGLFQGMNFYLYKDCTYKSLSKKSLAKLITTGDGVVINRDPNPDTVDPLENPTRFHAKDPSHKMVLTSHIILCNPDNQPTKKHNMEHVKTLKVDWLIQSILQFQLKNPDLFLN